jgi:hypothetical protein
MCNALFKPLAGLLSFSAAVDDSTQEFAFHMCHYGRRESNTSAVVESNKGGDDGRRLLH